MSAATIPWIGADPGSRHVLELAEKVANAATTVLSVETKNRSIPLATSAWAAWSTSSDLETVCSTSSSAPTDIDK